MWGLARISRRGPVRLRLSGEGTPPPGGNPSSELVVVEQVVGLVAGHPLLEQPEAEGVDGADEQPAELVDHRGTEPAIDPGRSSSVS